MVVIVKLPTPLRRHAEQAKSVLVKGSSAGEVLAGLVAAYPAMRASLFDEAGQIKSFVRVFVGGTDIDSLQGLDTPVSDGDLISIIPPVAGA